MNIQVSPGSEAFSSGGAAVLLTVLVAVLGMALQLVWIVIAWRAMKAHERLPDVLAQKLARRDAPGDAPL